MMPKPAEAAAMTDAQASLVQAMLKPEFYPKPPMSVTHKETHISHLFFAEELVFKVKKPVRYSFLDYSTLTKRRYFLQEELRLNRRLAPSVYIGVLPITFDDLGWRLGGWAEPAEYVLIMRRLPDKRMLPFLLDTGQVTGGMMRELAELLAGFHDGAPRIAAIGAVRYPALVERQWRDNLTDLEAFVDKVVAREDFRAIDQFGMEFIKSHSELLQRRAAQGWIRDVHGDLHTEHVCFAPEGIQIFDCIEFEPQFRQCDVAAEIAFLLMDIDVRGGAELVEPFRQRYSALIEDGELAKLLPFWKCYRALVRAKVYAMRGSDGFATAARYVRYATKLTWEPLQPFVIVISGFTGSGKSSLARALSERLGVPTINSDVVRKALAGKPGRHVEGYQEGIYRPAMTEKSYAKMARDAEKLIARGKGVILDGTFTRRAQRQRMARLAEKHGVPLLLIFCSASEGATQTRLARRQAQGQDISDGRWEVYLEQKKAAEPADEISPADRLEIKTETARERLIGECEKFLRSRLSRQLS